MDVKRNKNSCWKNRTCLEKGFIVALVITALLVTLLSLKLFISFPYADENSNVCLTETCIKSASNILKNLDLKMNPCEDFYQFTCGNFLKEAVIPDTDHYIAPQDSQGDHTSLIFKDIMSAPHQNSDPKYLKLMKTIYSSCMNTQKLEEDTLPFINNLLKNLGGWPVVQGATWNEDEFNWQILLYRLRKLGLRYNAFFQMYVTTDQKNPTRRILMIGQACISRRFKLGRNDSFVKATYEYMVDIAKEFGASDERAKSDLSDVIELQENLANITVPYQKRKNATIEYNLMKIKELEGNYSSIPWLYYINSYLSPVERLTSEDYVILSQPGFMQDLQELLASTRKRTIANYMFWLAIRQMETAFTESLRTKTDRFYENAYDEKSANKRWIKCFTESTQLDDGFSALYVKKMRSQETNTRAKELMTDIRDSFVETLKKTAWMDKKTKKYAMQKLEKLTSMVGFRNELLNDKLVDEQYSTLFLHPESRFVEILLKLYSWTHIESVRKLNEPIVKDDWRGAHSFAKSAYYSPTDNKIEVSSAMLEDRFFDPNRPQYMNYGVLGYAIGHEITHGFDGIGRQFDKDGNLVDWWDPETSKTFAVKTQCFVEQYGNFTVPDVGINLNGVATLEENIADNGGIKIAYRGYQKWLERNPPEKSLPGLRYTPQQMFWISAATSYCVKRKGANLKRIVEKGSHAPDHYRVIIPFMNSDYFARDFNCPLGTAMNPKYKCRVW